MRAIYISAEGPVVQMDPHRSPGEKLASVIGAFFYVTGTVAFIGVAVAFFAFHMYNVSSSGRIAFIVLFAGLFSAFQGLIFLLMARGGEQRRQADYIFRQVSALYAHQVQSGGENPGSPAPDGD